MAKKKRSGARAKARCSRPAAGPGPAPSRPPPAAARPAARPGRRRHLRADVPPRVHRLRRRHLHPQQPGGDRRALVEGFVWAFGYHAANWHPLTWLSHMLDAQLFGLWAGGHHLVSAAFHAANAVLLLAAPAAPDRRLLAQRRRGGALRAAPAAGGVGGLGRRAQGRPLGALLAADDRGLPAVRPPARRRAATWPSLGLFALGLAAKPMLVTLPFVLLLLDGWPLGRASRPRERPPRRRRRAWRAAASLEKAPFFAAERCSRASSPRGQTTGVIRSVDARPAGRAWPTPPSPTLRYLGTFVWPDGPGVPLPLSPRGDPRARPSRGRWPCSSLVTAAVLPRAAPAPLPPGRLALVPRDPRPGHRHRPGRRAGAEPTATPTCP